MVKTGRDPIVAFIEARVAEWEARALAAGKDDTARTWDGREDHGDGVVYDGHGEHVGLNDPAHALRVVKAIRAILKSECSLYVPGYVPASVTLRRLAEIWDKHPDYGKGW